MKKACIKQKCAPAPQAAKKAPTNIPKNEKLTKEQVNRILRSHKRLETYTVEQINEEIKKVQEDLSYIVDLEVLMNSIKTHKAFDALKELLLSPRPDINEAARDCAKIKVFKQNIEKLNIVKVDPLTQTEGVQKVPNKLDGEKLFSFCMEQKKIKEFYMQCQKIENYFPITRNLIPNAKFLEEVYPLIEEDFKAFKANASKVAFEDAKVDEAVVKRLQFALQAFDKKKIVKIGQQYVLEHQLLGSTFPGTIQQVVEAWGLFKNDKIEVDNYLKHEGNVSMKLFKKGILSSFDFDGSSFGSEANLRSQLANHLRHLSTVTFYPFDKIGQQYISSEMLQYQAFKTCKEFVEMKTLIEDFDREKEVKYEKEPITEFSVLDSKIITVYRKYIQQVKNYVAVQTNPFLAVMQTKPAEDFFNSYPLTDDKIEFTFEKNMFNKKDRYMNGEKRIQAMRALLAAPFIHGEQNGLLKVMKYIAACAQTTTNSTEKQQIIQIIDINQIMSNVLFALKEKIFNFELKQFCKEIAHIYFRYPDVMNAYKSQICNQLAGNMIQYIINNHQDNVNEMLQTVLLGLIEIQNIIPEVNYKVNQVQIYMNPTIKKLINFQMVNMYYTEDNITKIVPLSMMHKQTKKSSDFKEMVIAYLEKPFIYEIDYYNNFVNILQLTQPFFFEQQEKLDKVKDDQKKLELLVFEQRYVSLYQKVMSAFQIECQAITKPQKIPVDKKASQAQKKYINECNNTILELEHDINLHTKTKLAIKHIVNKIFLHNKSVDFVQLIDNVQYANFSKSIERFFKAILYMAKYTNEEYKKFYDEKRLASDFKVQSINCVHSDMLKLLGTALKQLCHQTQRHEKIKNLVSLVATIMKQFEDCNQNMQEEYNNFYTCKFSKKKPAQPVKRKGRRAPIENFGIFKEELNQLLFGFNITLQNVAPHQMIDIIGEMMISKTLTPLGVYCITHLQHVIKYDQMASLDELFTKQMPMSSLKTLIKFMFKSHEVNFDKIKALFLKSSLDAKVCIVEHFYYRAIEEPKLKEMFLKLLSTICIQNPDVFLNFFGEVFETEEEEEFEFNGQVLDAVRAIIESERSSIYMLSFAGYLKKQYNVPLAKALKGLEDIGLQHKYCPYVLIYLLKNYKETDKIIETVTKLLTQAKAADLESTVVFDAVQNAINSCDKFEIVDQANQLFIEILKIYTNNNKEYIFAVVPNLIDATDVHLQEIVLLLIQLDIELSIETNTYKNILQKHEKANGVTKAYLYIMIGQGAPKELIDGLQPFEKMIIQRVAKSLGHPLIYEKKKKTEDEFFHSEKGENGEEYGEEDDEQQLNCQDDEDDIFEAVQNAPKQQMQQQMDLFGWEQAEKEEYKPQKK